MFMFGGKKVLEEGDSPLRLGRRTVGDPFPQYWHKNLPIGWESSGLSITGPLSVTGGITTECPVTIQGDCTSALLVEKASGVDIFRVDTTNSKVYVTQDAMISIGSAAPPTGRGFYYEHPLVFQVNTGSSPGLWIDGGGGSDQILFGAASTTEFQRVVFEDSALFNRGIAWRRTEITDSLTMNESHVFVAWVGSTTPIGKTITLPPTVAAFGAGAKPGQIFVVQSEVEINDANSITIQGSGGDTINGGASVGLVGYGSFRFQTDGSDWFIW